MGRVDACVGSPRRRQLTRTGRTIMGGDSDPEPAHRDDPAVRSSSTVDAVGMKMGMNCRLTVPLMPMAASL